MMMASSVTHTVEEANDLADAYIRPHRPGVFETPRGVYVVRWNKQQTRMYGGRVLRGKFEYEPGAIYRIKETERISLDRGKALSISLGWCCVCGRVLTDPKSSSAGIGPVCAKKFSGDADDYPTMGL